LEKVAEDKHTHWKRLTVQEWYGEKKRKIEITSGTAVWSHSGKPALPIRWVIVRDPMQVFKTQALLCTDLKISAEQIVQWFPRRWQVEVTFHEVRTHLGVETQRQWATYPSSALHRPCSVCSPWLPCSPTYTPRNKSCLSSKPLGMLKSYQLFRMRSLSSSKLWHPKSIFELHQFTVKYKNHRRLAQNTALQPQIGHFFNNIFG
jgi:hypothetical protein